MAETIGIFAGMATEVDRLHEGETEAAL